jgi:hypothetical protein
MPPWQGRDAVAPSAPRRSEVRNFFDVSLKDSKSCITISDPSKDLAKFPIRNGSARTRSPPCRPCDATPRDGAAAPR